MTKEDNKFRKDRNMQIGSCYEFVMELMSDTKYNDDTSWIGGQPGLIENDEKFWLTWIVLLVLRLPGTLRTFIYLSETSYPELDKYLLYFKSLGDVGQAFFNCLIYCIFEKDVFHYFKQEFTEYRNELYYGTAEMSRLN